MKELPMNPLVLDKIVELKAFCTKWGVSRLALFGSAVRGQVTPKSDLDFLVDFDSKARPTLFAFVEMQDELADLFGRDVDLVSRRGLARSRNERRRNRIFQEAEVVYAR
jgi:uncharacterized protein